MRLDLDHSLEQAWLAEAVTGCYLPLIRLLAELPERDAAPWLTVSLSPTLLEMWGHAEFPDRYRRHVEEGMRVLAADAADGRHSPERRERAARLRETWSVARTQFDDLGGNLAASFTGLAREGKVELITTAATHAFLPAFQNDPAFRAFQIGNGIASFERATGMRPQGFWLPECGYFPGLEEDLAAQGIRWFALEEHGLTAADPPTPRNVPLRCPNGLLAVGRNGDLSRKVWSARAGYPGHAAYREFHRDGVQDLDPETCGGFALDDGSRLPLGLKYWRVTGEAQKDWYDPVAASGRAVADADDFVDSIASSGSGLVFLPFDAELFGHWWHEGPEWLGRVLRRSAELPGTGVCGVSTSLAGFPSSRQGRPAGSSWGLRGDYSFWINPQTDWLYPQLRGATRVLHELAERFGKAKPGGSEGRALQQAARELLLAGASDWPFMIRAGTTMDYAMERVRDHLERFADLWQMLESGEMVDAELAAIEGRNPAFPEVRLDAFG